MAWVLIVDDEPAACKLLALLLSEADFDCKTALSGAEALRLLENDGRDAIICDLNMPRMSGMELLAEVRRRSPRVALTAFDSACSPAYNPAGLWIASPSNFTVGAIV